MFQPAKSNLAGQVEIIKDAGPHQYRWEFADGASLTLRDDGQTKAHPLSGSMSLRQTSERTWTEIRTKPSDEMEAIVTVAADGRTLTRKWQNTGGDGQKSSGTFAARRRGEGTGLAGEWVTVSTDMKLSENASEMRIQKFESDGFSILTPAAQSRLGFHFDGKQYPETGAGATKGSTVAAKWADAQTFILEGQLNGKPWDISEYKISNDGRTLTLRYRDQKQKEWTTYRYDKR